MDWINFIWKKNKLLCLAESLSIGERGWILSRMCWKMACCSLWSLWQDLNSQQVGLVCPPVKGISAPEKVLFLQIKAGLYWTDMSHVTAEAEKDVFPSQVQPFLIQQRWQQKAHKSEFTGMKMTRLLYSSPDEFRHLTFILHFAAPERCL